MAVKVCTEPSAPVTVSVTTDPAGRLVVPLIVGVLSLPSAGASTVIAGAAVSMLPPSVALAVAPPTLTDAVTL